MFWVFILICLMLLWGVVQRGASMGKEAEYTYSDLYDKVQNSLVQDAVIQGNELKGHLKASPKEQFHTTLPNNYQDIEKVMLDKKVNFSIKEPQNNILLPLLFNIGPFVLLGAIWFFMIRQMQTRRQQGAVVRQEPRAPALHAAEEGHLQGRGRRG